MSITDQITRLQNAKASIKTSIENKGVTVPENTKLDGYPALIDNIQTGSGEETTSSYWPDFFEAKMLKGTAQESGRYLFFGAYIRDENDKNLIENLDVSNMVSINNMFTQLGVYYRNTNIKDLDFTRWNVSKCEDFQSAFYNSCYIDSINISGWDFSKAKSIYRMFDSSCFKTIDMSNCNTSTIKDFSSLFAYSKYLTSIDMTGCNTSNATNVGSMFNNSAELTIVIGDLDLSNLTNGLFPASYSNPFYKCPKLETIYLKNIYKNCTMTNASKWCINLGDTKVKDECLISIINELPDLINDKGLTATNKIVLTLPKTNTLTAEQVKVATDKGWTVANTTY